MKPNTLLELVQFTTKAIDDLDLEAVASMMLHVSVSDKWMLNFSYDNYVAGISLLQTAHDVISIIQASDKS